MIDYELYKILGTSLGLGLLVGLQREYSDHKLAGIRTFSLTTLFGSMMGLLAQSLDAGVIVAAGAIALVLLISIANYFQMRKESPDIGQTTEVALLLMYGLGAFLIFGPLGVGVALGATIAVLLYLKPTLGGFVDRMEPKDIRAIMQFAAISLVILPILPNQTYGPYDVLNPREVWMMVVLIVGLGLAGYFIYKMVGKNAGTLLNGILGGLISSTATTVTFAQRARNSAGTAQLAAFIILTASTVAVARVMIEVAVVSPTNLGVVAPPLLAVLVFMIILCAGLYWYNRDQAIEEMPESKNPAQLQSALIFGALYAIILLAVAVARDYFGEGGLYVVSIISGLTDVDAITLSLSNSMNHSELDSYLAWRLILIATLSNLVFKGGMATVLGSRRLAGYVWIVFGATLLFGLLVVWWWPAEWQF